MFGTIRRHQNWLWIVIIIVIIISFVVFFSPDAKFRGREDTDFGSINGRKLTLVELQEARKDLMLLSRFNTGDWPKSDTFRDNEVKQRVLMLDLARQFGIQISDDAVAEQIGGIFKDRASGAFNKNAYSQFVEQILPTARLGEADLHRFLRHELQRHQLALVAGLSGRLVSKSAVEPLFRREHEEFATEAVFFNFSNYLASVTITTNGLNTFFTNGLSFYRIPERAVVSYIHFAPSNYFSEVDATFAKDTNLTAVIESIYKTNGVSAYQDDAGKDLSPDAAKKKIRDDLRDRAGLEIAGKRATEVANELFGMQPIAAANLQKIAATKGLAVKVTEPFTESEGPKGIKAFSFPRAAFRLTEAEPLDQPVTGSDGVYLMAFKARVPSEAPTLASVQAKVTEDYRKTQAQEMARTNATSFGRSVGLALALGKSFTVAATEAKLEAVVLPNFSLSTEALDKFEERVSLPMIKDHASRLTAGQTSNFIPTREGGMILYLKARVPVSDEKLTAELPAFFERVCESRENYAFSDWFSQQLQASGLTTQQAPPPR